ncbi:MAG: hybrid sensor histidine kinase/response regulator [Cyanobacteria bacterium P01_A01_bin.114]
MNQQHDAHILAVDDSPDNLFLLESILSEEIHYRLELVEDGEAALKAVTKSPPDLILLDVMMPGLNGYDVTRKIRQNAALPYIPILLLTAHDQSSLVKGLDAGADDFLRKPFDVDELLARVRSMLRLKRSIDDYRYMVQQRDDFMARLTHDLRTPLVATNRVLELCLQGTFGDIADEAQEALDNVITNNTNLLAMANTLLEVYRHDAGQKQLSLSQISLQPLCDEIVQELAPLANAKGLNLMLETAGSLEQSHTESLEYVVEGDRLELRRLLTNLIGNAIKFTDAGHITVRLRTLSDRKVSLEVEDTGPGISEADQRQIFEWFQQGEHMRAGSGLGLHLSRRIAKLHGGELTVSSTVGQGSRFVLTLPLVRQRSAVSV